MKPIYGLTVSLFFIFFPSLFSFFCLSFLFFPQSYVFARPLDMHTNTVIACPCSRLARIWSGHAITTSWWQQLPPTPTLHASLTHVPPTISMHGQPPSLTYKETTGIELLAASSQSPYMSSSCLFSFFLFFFSLSHAWRDGPVRKCWNAHKGWHRCRCIIDLVFSFSVSFFFFFFLAVVLMINTTCNNFIKWWNIISSDKWMERYLNFEETSI